LTDTTEEEFVNWASALPRSRADEVADQIDLVGCVSGSCDSSVLDDLVALANDETRQVGTRRVAVAILGELRNPEAVPALQTIVDAPLPPVEISHHPLTDRAIAAAIASRAVEAIAYIGTEDALAYVLDRAANHPARVVRLKAIDAYLFNHGDSSAARDALLATVRAQEQRYVGLARKGTVQDSTTRQQFEAQVETYYQANPGER
jgi:hypothetical protein